jgi:hypothetical protein
VYRNIFVYNGYFQGCICIMKRKAATALLAVCALTLSVVPFPTGNYAIVSAAEEDTGNQYFECVNSDEVNISDTGTYTIHLKAKEGWQFDVADNTDVTGWIVNESGNPAFADESGIAFAVNEEDFGLAITIDAAKISGFNSNGSGSLYVKPSGGNPLVVEGDNHGQYTVVSEYSGL